MKRIARVNGNVKVIITGDEKHNCKMVDGKLQFPVKILGESDYSPVIIQNNEMFSNNVGESYNDLDWYSF